MKKPYETLPTWCGRIFIFAACGLASGYILISSYELIYAQALPFVHTITTVNLNALNQTYNLNASSGQNSKLYGYFGKPVTLKFPEHTQLEDIVPALRENNNGPWLARSDTLQLLIPARPREGNIGVTVLYCRSGFRTVTPQTLPASGQNVFMDTDENWQYVYRVSYSGVINQNQPYVVSDDGTSSKLVIVCNDSSHQADDIVVATLISVQGVEQ